MLINKFSNVTQAAVGDVLKYTIEVTNDDTFDINEAMVRDLLAPEIKFIAGSLKIDGMVTEGDVIAGVDLETMIAGQVNVITFDVLVINAGIGTTVNQASGNYNYQPNPNLPPQFGSAESNIWTVKLYDATLEVVKTVDQEQATLGDILNYVITVSNIGEVAFTSVNIRDFLNPALEVIPGTVVVNGVVVNLVDFKEGVEIALIPVGESVIITYSVIIKGGSCSGVLDNQAEVSGTYILPDNSIGKRIFLSNYVCIYTAIGCFKQLVLDKYLMIPVQKPDVEEINDVTATVKILDSYVIKTPEGQSNEGQILTGNKLIVNGLLRVVVSYTALIATQSVHSAHYDIPFSTFVVLPFDYQENTPIDVTGIIEKVCYQLKSIRDLYINATVLVKATIID